MEQGRAGLLAWTPRTASQAGNRKAALVLAATPRRAASPVSSQRLPSSCAISQSAKLGLLRCMLVFHSSACSRRWTSLAASHTVRGAGRWGTDALTTWDSAKHVHADFQFLRASGAHSRSRRGAHAGVGLIKIEGGSSVWASLDAVVGVTMCQQAHACTLHSQVGLMYSQLHLHLLPPAAINHRCTGHPQASTLIAYANRSCVGVVGRCVCAMPVPGAGTGNA